MRRDEIFSSVSTPPVLMDALRVIDDETVDIYLVNPKAPCFIRDDKENLHLSHSAGEPTWLGKETYGNNYNQR